MRSNGLELCDIPDDVWHNSLRVDWARTRNALQLRHNEDHPRVRRFDEVFASPGDAGFVSNDHEGTDDEHARKHDEHNQEDRVRQRVSGVLHAGADIVRAWSNSS